MTTKAEMDSSSDSDTGTGSPSHETHFRQELLGLLDETGVLNKFSAETSRSCGLSFFAGVKIDGMGILPLPVTPVVAAAVKQVCEVAPHGKGLETVIDMDVRRAFQIDSTKVTLSDELRKVVDDMVGECMDSMGVHGKVEAVLYKLLFYEKEGHFDWHRDTVRDGCGAYGLGCVRVRMRMGGKAARNGATLAPSALTRFQLPELVHIITSLDHLSL